MIARAYSLFFHIKSFISFRACLIFPVLLAFFLIGCFFSAPVLQALNQLDGQEAVPVGDALAGERIADQFCSVCHAIGKVGASPFDPAPPFRDIVEKWPVESLAESLSEGIVVGHEAMPEFQFGPIALSDLLAYLSTLTENPPQSE